MGELLGFADFRVARRSRGRDRLIAGNWRSGQGPATLPVGVNAGTEDNHMNKTHGFGIAALMLALFTAGCDQLPGAGGSSVLTVDLSAIAKATGQEQAIQEQAQAAREELNGQLMEQACLLYTSDAADD